MNSYFKQKLYNIILLTKQTLIDYYIFLFDLIYSKLNKQITNTRVISNDLVNDKQTLNDFDSFLTVNTEKLNSLVSFSDDKQSIQTRTFSNDLVNIRCDEQRLNNFDNNSFISLNSEQFRIENGSSIESLSYSDDSILTENCCNGCFNFKRNN